MLDYLYHFGAGEELIPMGASERPVKLLPNL